MADLSDEIAAALPEIVGPTREVNFIQGIIQRFPEATTTEVMGGLVKAAQAAVEPYGIKLPEALPLHSRTEHIAGLMLIAQALALGDIAIPPMEMGFVAMAVEGALLEEFLNGNHLATQVLLVLRGEGSDDARAYRLADRSN